MKAAIDKFVAELSAEAVTKRSTSPKSGHQFAGIVADLVKDRFGIQVSTKSVRLGQRSYELLEGGTFKAILLFKFMRNIDSAKKNWITRIGEFYKELGEACNAHAGALPMAIWAVPDKWLTQETITNLSFRIESEKQQGREIAWVVLPIPEHQDNPPFQKDSPSGPEFQSGKSPVPPRQLGLMLLGRDATLRPLLTDTPVDPMRTSEDSTHPGHLIAGDMAGRSHPLADERELPPSFPFKLEQAINDLMGRFPLPISSLEHRLIDSLSVENLRCFKKATLSFKQIDGKSRMWTIIIGENSNGKSTLLQALALATVSQLNAASLATSSSGGRPLRMVRQGSKHGDISLRAGDSETRVRISEDELEIKPSTGLPLRVLGYGPWRRLPEGSGLIRSSLAGPLDGLRSLFAPETPLTDPESWLKTQDYLRQSGKPNVLDLVRSALVELLPEVKSVDVDADGVIVTTHLKHRIPLHQMSDGYKVMATLVVDIIARLAEGQDISTPRNVTGIVLIDELDLHLHPRWQCTIVPDLRALFPNIQFIVTTHSPLILLGARKGELFRLQWADDAVDCVPDDSDPELLRVDQMLYEVFRLSSVRGPVAQGKLDRIEELLQKKYDGGLSKEEDAELARLKAFESELPYFEDPTVTITYLRDKLERLG